MSLEQLKLAAEIADSLEQIECIYVMTFPAGVVPDSKQYFTRFKDELPEEYKGVKFSVIADFDLEHGEEIAKFAHAKEAGLIVISSHGRKGISRLFLGSVAEKVVQNSSCPVLVIRE